MSALSKPGTWKISSESDTRWNATGKAAYVSKWAQPPELQKALADMKSEYGTPPRDLRVDYSVDKH